MNTLRRIHPALHVTPAMEAGVTDHIWCIEEIIALPDGAGATGEKIS